MSMKTVINKETREKLFDVGFDGYVPQPNEEVVDFIPDVDDLELVRTAKILELKQAQYQELSLTDWFYTRKLDTGQDVPVEVQNERNAIRAKYEEIIKNLN